MEAKYSTREVWLEHAVEALRPDFDAAGYPLPSKVHISVGFPSHKALSSKNRVVGQCWLKVSPDGFPHVFLSPLITDAVEVLGITVHELIHAHGLTGHKADFASAATKLGLTGKPTATVAGDALVAKLAEVSNQLGSYPHPAFDIAAMEKQAKKQTTRLIKAVCPTGETSDDKVYSIRITKVHLEKFGAPICPSCLKRMVDENGEGFESETEGEEDAA